MSNRPHLIAVDGEAGHELQHHPPPKRTGLGALSWAVVFVVIAAVVGWMLFLRADAELRRTRADLVRAQIRVFSLESRMLQVRRSAAALAATLGAAQQQARALEALAVSENPGARLDTEAAAAGARKTTDTDGRINSRSQ